MKLYNSSTIQGELCACST